MSEASIVVTRAVRTIDWATSERTMLAVAVVAVSAVTLTVETTFDGIAAFFAERPLAAGFVSGVILALLASAVVRAVVSSIRSARWDAVSRVGFGSLADDVTILIDTLNWLVTGHPAPTELPSEAEVQAVLTTQSLLVEGPIPPEDPGVPGSGPHKVPHTLYRSRLLALIASDEWNRVAVRSIARVRASHRRGLALWTASLATTDDLASVLVRLAALNHSGGALEAWVRLKRGWSGWNSEPSYSDDDVLDAWFGFLGELISVREDLWRIAAGGQDDVWEWFRRPLPLKLQAELAARADAARASVERRHILTRAISGAELTHPRSLL